MLLCINYDHKDINHCPFIEDDLFSLLLLIEAQAKTSKVMVLESEGMVIHNS